MAIKAVLFDMGGTLIKYDVMHAGEVFQRILLSRGISRSLGETKIAFLNAEKEAKETGLLSSFGKMKCEEYWHQWDALVLKHLRITEYVELARIVQSKWFDFVNFTLYPEVEDVLLELRQRGLKLGLISTAYEEEIHFILEEVNLEKASFDIIVGVDTTGKVKPDRGIFRYAISKLGVKPEEAMFVGNHVEDDYRGAESAGLRALLIDRTEDRQSNSRTIRDLKEILSQVR